MFKTAISGVASVFARRKIEAAALSAIAAISAVGLVRGAISELWSAERSGVGMPLQSRAAVPLTNAVHLSAAIESAVNRNRTASTIPAEALGLPNIAHPRVDSWVTRFTTDMRGSFATYLRRMTRYESMISSKLAARDMPQGLIYLAMIESGFNPTAKSRVSATGLWQFMTATGREYGLTVSRRVDERKNPARSTDAALEYLSDLYDRFGSWYLAAAAYNTGQGRVARVMKQVTGKTRGTDADYYRIAHRLPKETREYVPKMIAAARIGSNPERYGFAD
jgi:membrane-bound lytic murein transglycosylase D